MKLGILVCGLAGLASAFVGETSVWGMREAMASSTYAYIVGFALAAGVAAAKLKAPPMKRWHGIVALIGTALTLMVHRGALGELAKLSPIVKEHTAASLLFAVGFYGGVIFGIGAVLKPERR